MIMESEATDNIRECYLCKQTKIFFPWCSFSLFNPLLSPLISFYPQSRFGSPYSFIHILECLIWNRYSNCVQRWPRILAHCRYGVNAISWVLFASLLSFLGSVPLSMYVLLSYIRHDMCQAVFTWPIFSLCSCLLWKRWQRSWTVQVSWWPWAIRFICSLWALQ